MGIDYPIIGQRIQRLRRQRGITQEQLAEKLGVTVGYISQLERGVTKISLDTLGRICAALRGDMAAILSGASPEQASYRQDELMQKYARLTPGHKNSCCWILWICCSNTPSDPHSRLVAQAVFCYNRGQSCAAGQNRADRTAVRRPRHAFGKRGG